MEIKQTMKEIYQNNVEKGFWDNPRNIGEMLMLVTSELAEGLEADRKGRRADIALFDLMFNKMEGVFPKSTFEITIKDTFEDEMADAVIRIFDMCEGMGIDLEKHIKYKMQYNKTREKLHGKNY